MEKRHIYPVFPIALIQSIAYLGSQCSSATTNCKASYKAIQSLKILIWHFCLVKSMDARNLKKFKVFKNCMSTITAFPGILHIPFGSLFHTWLCQGCFLTAITNDGQRRSFSASVFMCLFAFGFLFVCLVFFKSILCNFFFFLYLNSFFVLLA